MKPNPRPCSLLKDWDIYHQRIVVRADLNIPSTSHTIVCDYRLRQFLPTLDYIRSQQATGIIITHIGNPNDPTDILSTRHLVPLFAKHGHTVHFCKNLGEAQKLQVPSGESILLENIRFFPEERTLSHLFAHELSLLGNYFIQDAFGSLRSISTSMTLLPYLFAPSHRSIGFLIEKELKLLTPLMHSPSHPYLLLIGGNKVGKKLPLLEALFGSVDTLALLPALSFTFLKSHGRDVGASTIDQSALVHIPPFEAKAQDHNVHLLFPTDYYVKTSTTSVFAIKESLSGDEVGLACGPHTLQTIYQLCTTSKTIVINGLMGFLDQPDTLASMQALLEKSAHQNATTVVGGGDTVALVEKLGLLNSFKHVSTGGGALLAVLGKGPLKNLNPFDH